MKSAKRPYMFPRGHCKNGHWLYGLGLSDGTVKIGITKAIRSRMQQHRHTLGESIAWVHLFTSDGAARRIEVHVCEAFEAAGKRIGKRELFRDVSKAEFIETVRASKALVRAEVEKIEARNQAHRLWSALYEKHVGLARAEYRARTVPAPEAPAQQVQA